MADIKSGMNIVDGDTSLSRCLLGKLYDERNAGRGLGMLASAYLSAL